MPDVIPHNEILPSRGILENVTPGARAALTQFGEFWSYRKGEHVIEQGAATEHLSIVIEGELSMALRSPEAILPLGYSHEGETVGEMGFMEGLEASATVTAAVNSVVWRISRDQFDQFLRQNPAAGVELLKEIVILLGHRARKGNERLAEESSEGE